MQVMGIDPFQKNEHDSCEDARVALALYKKFEADWECSVGGAGTPGAGCRRKEEKKKVLSSKRWLFFVSL